MTRIYDRHGNVIRRIVVVNGATITQVPTADGGWWNITVTR